MGKNVGLVRSNFRHARKRWGAFSRTQLTELRELTLKHGLSIGRGEIQFLRLGWYITHAGLVGLAERKGCAGIYVREVPRFCDPARGRWVFRCVVHKKLGSKGFVGYGDADPCNVSDLVRGAEMRVAETRAVNRALRKAYGIGLCSVEELGWAPRESTVPKSNHSGSSAAAINGNGRSAPARLRDRLCLLIREHQLDPTLVKAYAADYCATPALHNASREQVEAFINHLSERATNDRAALLCHLNSFAKAQEVSS
jgi:hypothetical protein